MLEKAARTTPYPSATLPPMDAHGELNPEPEAILDRRTTKFHGHFVTELLVHWSGALPEENTWERAWKLKAQYSTMWTRCFKEGGLVVGSIMKLRLLELGI
jgi:hypothetical protein